MINIDLLTKILKQKWRTDPFKRHFIEDQNGNLRKLYFQMLVKISQYFGVSDKKKLFLYKLFNSLKLININQYFNSDIDEEKLVSDFVMKFKNSKFLDLILVDILILSNIDKNFDKNFDKNSSEFINIIFSLFEIDKVKLLKIFNMAKYILTLDMGQKNYNLYPIILKNLENFVDVDKRFLISKYQVTQKEYKEIMGYNPSKFIGKNNPVDSVSWFEAVKFCNTKSLKNHLEPIYIIEEENIRLNIGDISKPLYIEEGDSVKIDLSKNGYRLPTREEWLYAAKGGKLSKGYKYSGSNCLGEISWGDMITDKTYPVGMKKPNELGIYDMTGNVWEWCNDWDNFSGGKILSGTSYQYFGSEYYQLSSIKSYNPRYKDSGCGIRIVLSNF